MDRESLKKSGLLEQYILGLTNRKESLLVEKSLEESSEVREDYDALLRELNDYAVGKGLVAPLEDRETRTTKDYEDLDHEMIQAITEKNHSLTIWRYGLVAACLLLVCLSGYLFRLSETNRTGIVTERAHHAQDNNAHERALEKMEKRLPNWQGMNTIKAATVNGSVLLHFVEDQGFAFLDLSHAELLSEDDAYFILLDEDSKGEDDTIVVSGHHQFNLHPVVVPEGSNGLKVFRCKLNDVPNGNGRQEELVAALSLD